MPKRGRGSSPSVATARAVKACVHGDTAEDDSCPICLDQIQNGVALSCKHRFCSGCIVKALQRDRRCPLCRFAPELDDDYENDDEQRGFDFATDVSVDRLIDTVPVPFMIKLLRLFGVNVSVRNPRAEVVATLLSEQLHYETDTSDEEDED